MNCLLIAYIHTAETVEQISNTEEYEIERQMQASIEHRQIN